MKFKENETVVFHNGFNDNKTLLTIKKITPTGIIRCSNGMSFKKDGYVYGRKHILLSGCHIEPATEDLIKDIKEQQIISYAVNMMHECNEISLETAKKIIAILKKEQTSLMQVV